MRTLHFIIDEASGDLTVEGLADAEVGSLLGDLLPPPLAINCARPATIGPVPDAGPSDGPAARIFGVWHGSVAEGPGRRSVVGFAGCPIRCAGCLVPHTWPIKSGRRRAVAALADALLDPAHPRDGVTVVGGEPFAQPAALAALLAELRRREPGLHLTVYSGYTLEALGRRREPAVRAALDLADLLIDGPFVARLHDGAGEWRGSTNQRLIPHPGRALAAGGPIPGLSAADWLADDARPVRRAR